VKRHAIFIDALVMALFAIATPAVAQRSVRPAPDSLRHIQSTIPLSGPPGTEVTIFSENLRLEARIWIGVGQIGSGFEVIGEGTQGQWGAVNATARIPLSATWDRPVVLIVLNGIFSPVALSDPFHVTDENGMIRRSGSFVTAPGPCPAMRDDDGYLYFLSGAVGDVRIGDLLTVEGRYTESGECGEGSLIQVVRRIG